jgi:hypothetical protein
MAGVLGLGITRCECCGGVKRLSQFACQCMGKLLCERCNHCLDHCKCAEPDVALPYSDQLAIAKELWQQWGVRV